MTASALRPKTNARRLLHFLGISLAVHVVLLFGLSIGYLSGGGEPAPAAGPAAAPAPAAPAAPPAAQPAGAPATAMPAAPEKPKDADAEYQKRQAPASEADKRKAQDLRPDLDQLK